MARRTAIATTLLAGLLVLAGCSALSGPDATSSPATNTTLTESTPTDATTAVETPTATSAPETTDTTTAPEARTGTLTAEKTPSSPSAPPSTESPDEATDGVGESDRVVVKNGTLPVDATEVYRRVERLMGTDAPAPTVEVADRERVNFSEGYLGEVDTTLGFSRRTDSKSVSDCGTFFPASSVGDSITITPGTLSDSAVELVLVHEFVHRLQPNVTGYDRLSELGSYDLSQALSEGSAVYVADEYARRYDTRWNGETPIGVRECLYEHVPGPTRGPAGWYAMGGQYVAQRLDSPAELSDIYRAPPETTEQLIHGLEPSDEPVRDLDVTVVGNERWSVEDEEREGELRLRSWLRTGLPADRVDTSATGWGADRLVELDRNGTTGVVWALRMDSAADADELAGAIAKLEATLESRNAAELESTRVGEETVVVFAGPESFVGNATADGTAGNVTVAVP
ncbi:hypothetical protein [Halosimplex sp. J119]